MTQEDKKLLLKDICARLPYGVKVKNEIQGDFEVYGVCENYIFVRTETSHADYLIEKIKPYLFPLSSMTDIQKKEYNILRDDTQTYHYEFGDIIEDTVLYMIIGSLLIILMLIISITEALLKRDLLLTQQI